MAALDARRVSMVALLALAGCDLGPDYHRPALEIPPAYRASAATAETAWPSADWWRGFGSPELDALIDQARRENFDLQAAIARVQQADAQVRIAGAGCSPASAPPRNASWEQLSLANSGRGGRSRAANVDLHDYSTGLNAAVRAGLLGQGSRHTPGRGGQRHVQPVRPADRGADRGHQRRQHLVHRAGDADRLAVQQHNLADAEQTLAVIRGRLDAGTASALDVAQQEALVAGVRATIPNLRSQLEQQMIGLGILIGRPAGGGDGAARHAGQPYAAARSPPACRPHCCSAGRTWPAPRRSSSQRIST